MGNDLFQARGLRSLVGSSRRSCAADRGAKARREVAVWISWMRSTAVGLSVPDQPVEKPMVESLLQAAVQAPSALNQQPWAFAVIQDRKLLAQYSTRVKAHVLKTLKPQSTLYSHREELANLEYNVFYGVDTLIIVCAKPEGCTQRRIARLPPKT